ncbi:MAG: hypothetical protein LH473_01545, partial [Chitinophagales bacterium]|nr:hypothetical protein [Chitinophagales bacterium]
NRLLDDDGIFCVLLPEYSSAKLIACGGNYNLLPFRKIMIRDSINSKVISTIHFFVYRFPRSINEMRSFEERTLTLKDEAGNYTSDLKELLGDFYLHF